jgi:hypothetical protein
MNAADARAIAESYSDELDFRQHLETILREITKNAKHGKFQLCFQRIGNREFTLNELVKLGYQIQTIGENTIISW